MIDIGTEEVKKEQKKPSKSGNLIEISDEEEDLESSDPD